MTPLTARPRTAAYPLRTVEVHLVALVPDAGGSPVPMARLNDVAAALELTAEATSLTGADQATAREDGVYVTLAGVKALARTAVDPVAALRFVSWLGRRLATPRADPGTTRWGWQPLRAETRRRHLTVASLADQLNALELENVPPVTRGNVGGAAVGATLPKPELLRRLEAAWGMGAGTLFTADVVVAVKRRDARLVTPRPVPDVVTEPPVVRNIRNETTMPSPASSPDPEDVVSLTFDGGEGE